MWISAHLLEVVRQRAGQRADRVVAPVVVQIDRLDPHLEHLPRLGAAHRDRPGQDVRAAELRLHASGGSPAAPAALANESRLRAPAPAVPETVEIVTVSPLSTVISGFSAASKYPQCTVSGTGIQSMIGHILGSLLAFAHSGRMCPVALSFAQHHLRAKHQRRAMANDTDGKIFVGKSGKPEYLTLRLANRHGLATGATGTGKTVTLQVLAEGFSARRRSGVRRRRQGRPVRRRRPGRAEGLPAAARQGHRHQISSPTNSRWCSGTCTASKAIRSAPPCSRWARC